MKNFLSTDNFISSSHELLNKIIQSSGEMEGYPITNILESEDKAIWLSTEVLPQEITINISKQFFKEFPKKISAIGIYCWHAYPTNPKLIEIQISKNKDKKSFVSLGNFDLCLKPGRQLLQLDDELDYIATKDINNNNNNDLIIKLIIKETFGDKRTYTNNIYLYEDMNMCGKKFLNSMEPIKEEDSNSMIYLRESRERTLPKSAMKSKKNSLIDKNTNLKDLLEIDFDAKSEENYRINKNENKILGGIESEFIMSDSELSEKYNNNLNHNNNNNKVNDNDNDFFNDIKPKDDDMNILNKTGNKNESTNNNSSNNNEQINKGSNKDSKDNNNNSKNNNIMNIKNNERYFMEKNENDDKTNINNKIIMNKEESHDIEEKEKSLNINDFNDDDEDNNENENIHNNNDNNIGTNNININNQINDNDDNNSQNYIEKEIDEQSSNSYREEDLILLIDEFENYKKNQSEKVKNYEKKINYLENQFKEMTLLSNRMKNNINKILENQMKQKRINQDNLLNSMRKMINERITKVFSNFHQFSNFYHPPPPSPFYPMENEYYNPNYKSAYNYNNIVGETNYDDMNMNFFGNNSNLRKNRIKSEKKKSKNNIVTGRNKSGQKIQNRNNYNKTEILPNKFMNNKNSNLIEKDNSNNILHDEYDDEDFLDNYYINNGFYTENNNLEQRNIFNNNFFNNNNLNYTNNRNSYNNNEFIINNRAEKINNKNRFISNQNNNKKQFNYNNKNNQEEFSSNNEIEELFNEFRNNLGEKISEKILKPSISKIENYMKGNLSEVKNAYQNKGINQNNIKKPKNIKENKEINNL